jgi:hypothetical protein
VAAAALVVVCVFICLISWRAFPVARSKGLLPAGLLSALLAVGTLIAVLPEYFQLTTNAQKFVLQRTGGYSTETITHYAPGALNLLSLGLLGVFAGELFFVHYSRPARIAAPADRHPGVARRRVRAFLVVGIVFGTGMALILGRHGLATASQLQTRGTSRGKGVLATGTWLVPSAMIVAISNRKAFRTSAGWLAAIAITAAIGLTTGTRSPLLLVGAYFAVATIRRITLKPQRTRTVVKAIAAVYLFLTLLSVISLWRGHLISQGQAQPSLSSSIVKAAENPIGSLPTTADVNTLDGAIFSQIVHADYGVQSNPSNWATALGLFVPSQLWHGKPTPLSQSLSARYLGFGTSGMFLSGVGYAWLTLYGDVGVVLWGVAFGLVVGWLCRRVKTEAPFADLFRALIVYFTIEMWFAGDSFVVYYVGAIAIACAVATAAARAMLLLEPETDVAVTRSLHEESHDLLLRSSLGGTRDANLTIRGNS